jgi:hypothetical protein
MSAALPRRQKLWQPRSFILSAQQQANEHRAAELAALKL